LSDILSLPSRFLIRDRGGKRGFYALRSRLSRPLSVPASQAVPVTSHRGPSSDSRIAGLRLCLREVLFLVQLVVFSSVVLRR
jgi:hypothetical protein